MKLAELVEKYPQFKAFADAQRGPLQQALAVDSCMRALYQGGEPQPGYHENVLSPCKHHELVLPAGIVLAACEAAGILDDVLAALSLSIVQSNGCVSILESGRLLASLSLSKWQELIGRELCPTT